MSQSSTLAGVVVFSSFAMANLNACLPFLQLKRNFGQEYSHGWPFTYMTRELENSAGTMGGVIHAPWPYFDNPPLIDFYPALLMVNVVFAIGVAALTMWCLERNVGKTLPSVKFSLWQVAMGVTYLCLLLLPVVRDIAYVVLSLAAFLIAAGSTVYVVYALSLELRRYRQSVNA